MVIAWISTSACNPFYDLSRAGAAAAGADLTAASGQPVTVLMLEPQCVESPDGSPSGTPPCEAQTARIQEAIDKKADAIAIDVSDAACATPFINDAVDAGVKVITFGDDAPESKRLTFYGMDNKAAAAFLMDALAIINGGTGNVALQTHMEPDGKGGYDLSKLAAYVERHAGFFETLAKYPDMTNVATIPCVGNDLDDPTCSMEAEQALTAQPDIKGFFFARGKLLREHDLETNAPLLTARVKEKTIHSVSFDALPESFEAIREGYAEVVVSQKVFGWGYDPVMLAYDIVTANRPVEQFTDAGWYTVCPNNLAEFERNNQAQDYRTPLSKCSLLP
ncbi:substrate-binding domain-containing protein [Sorangium sp. So ce295]|uniref:substrate-binding domain-containing protein n=1 Tax=Sorangium sp. So ce295 TaxID=3133295 RepID=UPI003F6024E8